MHVDRHIKVPALILPSLLLSKTDICLKRFFRKMGTIFELCDFKNRGCLTFLVADCQPYITAVWFWFSMQGKQRFLAISLSLPVILDKKEGTTILERVAFLLRLSM